MILLGLMIAAPGGALANENMLVPIDYEVVQEGDVLIPISDSVRAATWDELVVKPVQPVRLRLACIVFVPSGAPGACVPASFIEPGQKTVDWAKVHNPVGQAAPSEKPADPELLRAATRRIDAARVVVPGGAKDVFAIRFFDEVISPDDERPPLALTFDEDLKMRDVTLAEPLDPGIMKMLYPPVAMRYSVNATVSMTCQIEMSLRLLCRDPGVIESSPSDIGEFTGDLME